MPFGLIAIDRGNEIRHLDNVDLISILSKLHDLRTVRSPREGVLGKTTRQGVTSTSAILAGRPPIHLFKSFLLVALPDDFVLLSAPLWRRRH